MILDRQPNIQVSIYGSQVYLTKRSGAGFVTYPVDASEIVSAFSKLPTTTGILPPNTIATGLRMGKPFYAVVMPAREYLLKVLAPDGVQARTVALPPMLWCGWTNQYRVFGLLTDSPTRTYEPLMRAPMPNTYDDGKICWGDVTKLPSASADAMRSVWSLLLEGSNFSLHVTQNKSKRFPTNIVSMWECLTPGAPYPIADLMPTGLSLAAVTDGSLWGTVRPYEPTV